MLLSKLRRVFALSSLIWGATLLVDSDGLLVGGKAEPGRNSGLAQAAIAASQPIVQPIAQLQPQPLTLYQPLQPLQWEGERLSPTGIAYFPLPEGVRDTVSEADLAVARTRQDQAREAQILAALGLARQLQGEYESAIQYYRQGLEITQRSADSDLKLMILGNLGLAQVQSGNYYAEAIANLQDYAASLPERRKLPALGNLANAYFGADLYGQAIALHQQRLTLARQTQDSASQAKGLSDLGLVYQGLGEYVKAAQLQTQALDLAQKIRQPRLAALALGNLGILAQIQGDYTKATQSQQQRLTLVRQLQDLRGEVESLANLGGLAYMQGDYPRAIALYEQAWNLTWNRLHDVDLLYRIRGNQGLVYAQMGNPDQALAAYGQYFQYANSRSNRREIGIAKINAAAVRSQSGNLSAAAKTLREAIETWEALRGRLGSNDSFKISLFETQNAPYSNLQSVLLAQNQPEAALEISERGRARVFAELLARRISALPSQTKASGTAAQPPLTSPLTSPTIAQIQQTAKSHRATLVEYSVISAQFRVQGRLETHEAELLIWVVQPTGGITLRRVDLKPLWQCAPACKPQTLADLVALNQDGLGETEAGKATPATVGALRQLHQLLIQPIADLLPQDPTAPVILIPYRALLLVPFAALQDAQGKYLVEQHTLSVAPSIQVLELTEQLKKRLGSAVNPGATSQGSPGQEAVSPARSNQVPSNPQTAASPSERSLIVGNPLMPKVITSVGAQPEQLAPLPAAEQEATAIARLFNTSALIGETATKSKVLQQINQANLIHLATHGLLGDFWGLGIPGAIALAPDAVASGKPSLEENGLLTANEIFDLRLQADLVVLSACNTGQGKITGDGVVGLSRALIAAKVPSVIVSLWAVSDETTALLMTEFYRNLQRQPDKAQALRQAMLTTMQQHPHPLDWAAFLLIGESR